MNDTTKEQLFHKPADLLAEVSVLEPHVQIGEGESVCIYCKCPEYLNQHFYNCLFNDYFIELKQHD